LQWNEGGRGYVASLVWFLLAVFSKESSVPFALAVFFILYGFYKLPLRRSVKLTAPFLLVAFFFAVCERLVMGRSSQCPPLSGTYGQTLIDMLPVGAEYLRLLLGIPPFCADYNFMVGGPLHPFFSGAVLGGLFLLLLLCVLSAWLWRRPQWRLSAFGLIWIALFLLPVSNLVPMMQYMAERFLYLPLMGFLLALGGVILNISRLRGGVAAAAVALIVIWTGTSLGRMGIWRDELTLFMGTELEHPGIKRVEKNAVGAILRLPQINAGRAATALSPAQAEPIIATLQKARQIYPENDALTTQLGVIEMKTGRLPEAVGLLELAVRQNPASAERWYNLASIERLDGQPAKAREACAQALSLDPQDQEALHLQAELEHDLRMKPAPEPPVEK
jgi:protein O-mannosyl-transferase